MELSDQEREELMACEFVVTGEWYDGPYTVPGRLIDIDSDIGITIVDKNNPDDYLECLVGPSASKEDGEYWDQYSGLYEALFQEIIQQIRDGQRILGRSKAADKFEMFSSPGPTSEDCAFNK